MAKFQDNKGTTWQVDLTVAGINRVKSLLKVDLLEPLAGTPPVLTRLELDIALVIDVTYCLIKPQADEAKISDEDFGARLGGQAVADMRKAFWETFDLFFQSLGRTEIVQAIRQQKAIVDKAIALAETRIQQAATQSHRQLEQAARSEPSSTNVPAPPASTPDRTPSASSSTSPVEPSTETPSSAV